MEDVIMAETEKELNGCKKIDEEQIKSVSGGLATPAPRRCRSCGNIVVPNICCMCPICLAENNFDDPE